MRADGCVEAGWRGWLSGLAGVRTTTRRGTCSKALAFRVDESEVEVPAGGGIGGPRGAAHTLWNPSPRSARYLIVMTAAIHRLVEALHDPKGDADISTLFREHDSTLIGRP